jgi:hypothetical protein
MNLSWGYGTPPSREVSERVLLGALDAGYTHFDTAALYGLGHNEKLIGEVLGPHRSKFMLASKCGVSNNGKRELNGRPEVLKATCEQSLQQLQTEVIDLYYLHRWDQRVPIEDSVGALSDLVREGKVRTIGLSEISAATLRRAHAVHPIAALQTEYSPWTRNPEVAVLEACRELGTAFVAFSPVGRGFLAGRVNADTVFEDIDIRKTMPRFQGEAFARNLKLLEAFKALAAEAGCTPAQLCMAWLLAKGGDILPIPGTADPAHMVENARSAEVLLSPDMVARVDTTVNEHTVHGHRYSEAMRAPIDTEELAA